jgi:hypothetical protein
MYVYMNAAFATLKRKLIKEERTYKEMKVDR